MCVTNCIIEELKSMGEKWITALKACSKFEVLPWYHDEGIKSADECIKLKIGDRNRFKYLLGTQDDALRHELKDNMIIPTFFFKSSVALMDAPSDYIKYKMMIKQQMKHDLDPEDKRFIKSNIQEIQKLKAQENKERREAKKAEYDDIKIMYQNQKKAKGPNPLSYKRPKQTFVENIDTENTAKSNKKRRKRAGKRKRDELVKLD